MGWIVAGVGAVVVAVVGVVVWLAVTTDMGDGGGPRVGPKQAEHEDFRLGGMRGW